MTDDKYLFTIKFTPGKWHCTWCDKDRKSLGEGFIYQFNRCSEITFSAPEKFHEVIGLGLDCAKFGDYDQEN